ncbi:RES domain-containing protein [Pseudomonas sp. P66]|uniref:RES domain-containing protein n=1 Tax=Pseudomonas arcuscaelestis TaxID=2710591 RepID=A0ABS2BYK2_9PSED|nr:RES domain-containing protein [Pseudomonas arcuscaelestis]MBM5458700.1 RES domain-containing protein [Pseudomonas arcuscaelestis]
MPKHPMSSEVHFWRLDSKRYAHSWDHGIGAEKGGGRWNPKGLAVVYASLDASTAILEVAVHKGFGALDALPHVLTQVRITDPSKIHILDTSAISNSNWLIPGTPSQSQQLYGAELLSEHPFVVIPSSVSRHSWNVVMNPALARGLYEVVLQEPFALDGRLHPPLH